MLTPERNMGHCKQCNRLLLINPNTGYCLVCENAALRERIGLLEFQLEQFIKKRGQQEGSGERNPGI